MRILIFNWQDIRHPLGGGAEVHMHEIFSRVAARGHEVTLFCSHFPGAPREETIDGIRIVREGGRYLFNFRVAYRYWSRFRKERFDVVIDDMNKVPFFTPLFVRRPLVILVHHLFEKSIFQEVSIPLALYVYLLEKLAVKVIRRRAVPMFVVSESTKSEVIAHGISADALRIVPNCVDHTRYRPSAAPRSESPLVGYFGRLKKYKSVEHLLEAFRIVHSDVPAARVVVIGDGDYRPALERRARELSLGDAVRFTGYVDEETKVRLLCEAWFLVNTSAKEGWGLTVIEANACGTPVIASDVPGLRDAVRDNETGMLYPYGNISILADKMKLLLGNAAERERLGREAHQWSRTFDWQAVADTTIGYLGEIVDQHQRRQAHG